MNENGLHWWHCHECFLACLRIWWAGLWVREDEFHYTLDMDWDAVERMSSQQAEAYRQDVVRRREIAHRRDFERRH